MALQFKKATRQQAKLRLALIGPSGSGKSYSALSIAKHLGKRIAVIDSEHGSASLYAGDVADFDVLNLESYAPKTYVEAIHAAEEAGYDVIVIDSLSHAWAGKGGALEMVDNAAKRSQSGNTYMAWRDVTPQHNALVDAMIRSRAHLIVTMRSKTEYVLVDGPGGKKVPKKIGMAPIQRDGVEFEFTVVADMDLEHNFMVSKTRCSSLDEAVINRPGEQVARTLKAWLDSGAPESAPASQRREAMPERDRPFGQATNGGKQPEPRTGSGQESRTTTESGGTGSQASQTGSGEQRGAVDPDEEGHSLAAVAARAQNAEPRIDEYGIEMPPGKCPVVRPGKPNAGKAWSEMPDGWLEKMYGEWGSRLSPHDKAWAEYLMSRRQALKAREAAQAEMAQPSDDTGGWVAGDEDTQVTKAPAGEGEAAQ